MAVQTRKETLECPLLALSGHADRSASCPLLVAKRTHCAIENRWDNSENKHWDSMEGSTKVGHDKCLNVLDWGSPSTGTKIRGPESSVPKKIG